MLVESLKESLLSLDAKPSGGRDPVTDLFGSQGAGVDCRVIALSGTFEPGGNPCRETPGA